jgi:hypothetical protein
VPEATRRYFSLCETVAEVVGHFGSGDVFHLRHEAFIEDPTKHLRDLCRFLGEDASDEYLTACAGIVFTESHMSRKAVSWSREAIDAVADEMGEYGFLEGYSFEG